MPQANINKPTDASANGQAGYGNPPLKRRFKISGNTNGRPKGSKNRKTIVKMIANEMHTITENGKRRRLSTFSLVLLRLRNLALATKDIRSSKEFHRLIKLFEPQAVRNDVGYLVVPPEISPNEWMAREEEKNARVDEILKANPGIDIVDAINQFDKERKAEKARILEEEKLARAAEIIKENPDIDQAEAVRLAQAERKAMLRGESVDLDTLRKRQ